MTKDNETGTRRIKIGDIYVVNFYGRGNVQKGIRPGLIFQNNKGNEHSPNVIALPLTTKLKKMEQPTHVFIPAEGTGLKKDSMILCENPECISKDDLGRYITTLPDEIMEEVAGANLLATSAISYIDPSALYELWERAVSLNTAPAVV